MIDGELEGQWNGEDAIVFGQPSSVMPLELIVMAVGYEIATESEGVCQN